MTTHNVESSSHNQSTSHFSRLAVMNQEKDVPKRLPSSASLGLTQRMAAASSRRPRRTLAIWGLLLLAALVLVGTSLKGLTTTAQVVGTTQSSQAVALYNQVVGSALRGRLVAEHCDKQRSECHSRV